MKISVCQYVSVCKSLFIYFWCLSACLCIRLVKSFKQRKSVGVRMSSISQKFHAAKVSICNDVFALVRSFKQRKSVGVRMSLH